MTKKSPAARWRELSSARDELARAEKSILRHAIALGQSYGFTVERYRLLQHATSRREKAVEVLKSAAKRGRKGK